MRGASRRCVAAGALAIAACGYPPLPPRPDAPTTCAPPYTQMTTGCYRFVPTPASWLDAERDCEADAVDAHLVVIDSVDEHYTIHGLASQVADVWLAYTDRVTEGRLRWVAPGGIDPTSNNCFFGSAVNNDMLDCVTQDGPDACPDWRYRNCSEGHAYVCERDGAFPDPTAYTPH